MPRHRAAGRSIRTAPSGSGHRNGIAVGRAATKPMSGLSAICLAMIDMSVRMPSMFSAVLVMATACREPVVLSGYGSLLAARGWRTSPHRGVDFRGGLHSPVLAAADGLVWMSYFEPSIGYVVVIAHPGTGRWTHYAHLGHVDVKSDALVSRGQVIGTVGLFKKSGGVPHVHLQLCTTRMCGGGQW